MEKKFRHKRKPSCPVHRPIVRKQPLCSQYRTRRRSLSLTNQQLADRAGCALTTVARELGLAPRKPMSLPLALQLGEILGFDPAYIAMVHARDVANARSCASRGGRIGRHWERILKRLEHCVSQHAPFETTDISLRLAFRLERLRRHVSIEKLISGPRAGETSLSCTQIRRYESAVVALDLTQLVKLNSAVSVLAPNADPLSLDGLDRLARQLEVIHCVNDTVEWRNYVDVPTTGYRFHCPYENGYGIRIGVSPTACRGIRVKFVRVDQPRRSTRSRVRIIGQQPQAIQLAVVLKGRVEVILSRTPFPLEQTDAVCQYDIATHDILSKRTYNAGDIIISPARYHCRVAFHGRESLMAIIELRENVHS